MPTTSKVLLCAGLALAFAAPAAADDGIPIYTAKTITVNTPGQLPSSGSKGKAAPLATFYGTWRTRVPGGTWITPGSPGSGTDVLHVSAGAKGTALTIRSNRTWLWKGKTGAWKPTGDAEYPLLLLHAVSGHDWKVGVDVHNRGQILIWDGYTYFQAKH